MPPQILLKDNTPAIQFYIDAGFALFPLVGKIPPKGIRWSATVYNPLATTDDFPSGNFGVKLGEDDLVLDIDPRAFQQAINPVPAFERAINFRLKDSTFIVRTGGGGYHIYFKKPADWPVRGTLKEFPGIELKTKGQYVVGAGSIHPETKKPYLVTCNRPVAQAPASLLELVHKLETSPDLGISHFVDDDQTKQRFIQYLKTAPIAVEGESGDKTTFVVACTGRDLALGPDIAYDLMAEYYNFQCQPPWSPDELKRKVYNAYQYGSAPVGSKNVIDKFEAAPVPLIIELRQDQNQKILKQLFNAVSVFNLEMPGTLALNVFSEDIIFLKPAPWHRTDEKVMYWTDEETARCKYYFGTQRRFEPPSNMIEEAIVNVAGQKPFHPIKDYIEGIEWDGFERLKNWTSTYCGVADNEYSRAVGLKTLVAAVTRIYHPGHKFDYIPVFEGPQGIGKSRAVEVLGGEWYGDITIDVHAKDTVDIMRRLWIIEVSEMETQFRTETQALKSFLSRSQDICRLAYGRRSKTFPRHNVFIGTMNPEEDGDAGWLKDTTGNRRFWPLLCGVIDVDAIRKVRDQLWAEAYLYYKKKTALHFEDTAVEAHAQAEQIKRMGVDPWKDTIQEWIVNDVIRSKDVLSGADIFQACLGGRTSAFTRTCQNRIALIMKSLNWEKGVFYNRDTKGMTRGYRRPFHDAS